LAFGGQTNPTGERFGVPEIPRPGPALPFDAWCRALVERVRELLPDVRASRRRNATVVLRYADKEVTIVDDRGAFWIRQTGAIGSGIIDADRHDAFTAHTIAKSIAGMLDARLSGPG
jgi:hypothetical protein